MRHAVKALALVFLGAVLGAGAVGFFARRVALELDRDARYGDALKEAGTNGRVLRELDAGRESAAREVLERDLLGALARADELADQGARLPLANLFAGPTLGELGEVEAYVRAHSLDRAVVSRLERLRGRLCAALSPNSKYRGLCS